jgi:hypothetical protein
MGEAGGGLPGGSPENTLRAGAGKPSPPAFPSSVAGYCGGRALPLVWEVFPEHSSFSVLIETPMASAIHFIELNCYVKIAIGIVRLCLDMRAPCYL